MIHDPQRWEGERRVEEGRTGKRFGTYSLAGMAGGRTVRGMWLVYLLIAVAIASVLLPAVLLGAGIIFAVIVMMLYRGLSVIPGVQPRLEAWLWERYDSLGSRRIPSDC